MVTIYRDTETAASRLVPPLGWAGVVVLCALLGLRALDSFGVDVRVDRYAHLGLGAALALFVSQMALIHWSRGADERRRLNERMAPSRMSRQALDYLVSLLNVSRAVSGEISIQELGQVIVDSCRDCFECDEASLMMLDPARGELTVIAFAGHRDKSLVRNARLKIGEGVAGEVALTQTPLILGPQVESDRFQAFQEKKRMISSAMIAPVTVRGRAVGVLNASTGNPAVRYVEDDLRILCILAEHAGIVVAKARDGERVLRLVRRMRRRNRRRAAVEATAPPTTEPEDRKAA